MPGNRREAAVKLSERAIIHANKMDDEGLYVTANVLTACAEALNNFEQGFDMNYKLQSPFEIYHDGKQIADKDGHICSAENPEIAEAILAALQLAERLRPILAARTPTPEMLEAAQNWKGQQSYTDVWNAMIDAALSSDGAS